MTHGKEENELVVTFKVESSAAPECEFPMSVTTLVHFIALACMHRLLV